MHTLTPTDAAALAQAHHEAAAMFWILLLGFIFFAAFWTYIREVAKVGSFNIMKVTKQRMDDCCRADELEQNRRHVRAMGRGRGRGL